MEKSMPVAAEVNTPPIHGLPPGPRTPKLIQSLLTIFHHERGLERNRARYGGMFTAHSIGIGTIVVVSDPDLIKQVFTADPTVLHAGDRSPLRKILGPNSLLGIDEDRHLSQRKLLLPPFHGQRMASYEAIIEEEANREIDSWPENTEFRTTEPMMRITLNVILRAVFGAEGENLQELERLMPAFVTLGSRMALLTFAHKDLGPRSPWGRFLRMRKRFDVLVADLIDRARRDPHLADRADVLSLLVQAKHEDGSPMTFEEIADELLTLLAAGHETTATTLSWTVERLRRHPEVLARLVAEADEGGRALRDATIKETQRIRPVIPFAGRFVQKPFELGGYVLPPGVSIGVSMVLAHSDERLFDQPRRFRPDRFLDVKPDTYRWVPFGGGIRRCIGAAFAHLEMDVVLRIMLRRLELLPTTAPSERWHYRGVAFAPADGGLAVVRRRAVRDDEAESSVAAAA
jgi:cytochrome P450